MPNLAVVYARRTGELVVSDGQRLSFSERFFDFVKRYEVDLGDHFHTLNAQLPAGGDAHQFDATVSLTYSLDPPRNS